MKLNIQDPQPGIYAPEDASMEDYHKCRAIGRSALKVLDEGMPADLQRYLVHGFDGTQAMAFGTAVGLLLSEPDEFARQVIQRPAFAGDKAPAIFKGAGAKQRIADWKLQNAGKMQLSEDEWDQAHRMVETIRTTPAAAKVIGSPNLKVEHSILWRDEMTGELVKARPDFWRPDAAMTGDLKVTSGDLSDRELQNYCASYYVALQGSMCAAGLLANGYPCKSHAVIFASRKTEKVRVVVMKLDEANQVPSWIEVGDAQFEALLAEYAKCKATETFEDWGERGTLLPVPAYVAVKVGEWKNRTEQAAPKEVQV